MKSTTLTVDDLIGDMAEARRKITDYTAGIDEASFRQSSMAIGAVVKNIEIVGKAANLLLKNLLSMFQSSRRLLTRSLNVMPIS